MNSGSRTRLYSIAAASRLTFVLFALLLLIVVPVFTNVLIAVDQRQLLAVSRILQEPMPQEGARIERARPGLQAALRQAEARRSAERSRLQRRQNALQSRIDSLRLIQFGLTLALGLLGLLSCWYTLHALQMMRRNRDDLESLFETASHLSVGSAPEAMHQYLTRRVALVLHARQAALWSYDTSSQQLIPLLPAFGFDDAALQRLTLPVRNGEWAYDLLFKDRTLCSNRLPAEVDAVLFTGVLPGLEIDSVLAVPLIAQGTPVGILCAYNKQERLPFTAEDARLLRTFAGQAAFVLRSAQLYADTRARNAQLAALAALTADINSSLELRDMIAAFLQGARALIPFRRGQLALTLVSHGEEGWVAAEQTQTYDAASAAQDREETELLRRLRGKNPRRAEGATPTATVEVWTESADGRLEAPSRLPTAQMGLLGQVLQQQGKPRIASENEIVAGAARAAETGRREHSHRDADPDQEAAQSAPRSLLLVPLTVHQTLLGALQLESDRPNAFGETQLALAQQIAGQLAAAVQNVRLYQEATYRADQLEWAMQETHHRIKNNLQSVSAILDVYLMDVDAQDTVPAEALRHALREIRTIATVHDLLSEDVRIGRVSARHLMETLVPMLVSGPVALGKGVHAEVEADDILIPSKIAAAFALATNELIANAIQHGGRGRERVAIRISFCQEETMLCLTVADDGPGFPLDYRSRISAKIGLDLVQTLIVRDHSGTLDISSERGAQVRACIPFRIAPENQTLIDEPSGIPETPDRSHSTGRQREQPNTKSGGKETQNDIRDGDTTTRAHL